MGEDPKRKTILLALAKAADPVTGTKIDMADVVSNAHIFLYFLPSNSVYSKGELDLK